MTISDICDRPTTLVVDGEGFHESLLRAHHIVGKVKQLLEDGATGKVVLELIEEMSSAPQSSRMEWIHMRPATLPTYRFGGVPCGPDMARCLSRLPEEQLKSLCEAIGIEIVEPK